MLNRLHNSDMTLDSLRDRTHLKCCSRNYTPYSAVAAYHVSVVAVVVTLPAPAAYDARSAHA